MTLKVGVPSRRAVFSTAASMAATIMLIRNYVPLELRRYVYMKLIHYLTAFATDVTLVIDEFEVINRNKLFQAAEIYLGNLIRPCTRRFRASILEKEKKIKLAIDKDEEITDTFCGFQLKWKLRCTQGQGSHISSSGDLNPSNMRSEIQNFELSFHKKHKNKVVDEYLPYILQKSKEITEAKKTIKLFSLKIESIVHRRGNPWYTVNFDHPATFDTLAMDANMKKMIIDDLDTFVKQKELYRKVGRAWKRGYLLFGPPGTGKSSLIAAMANYMNFDVFDLELTDIRFNSDLRRVLVSTTNRSILVVEDIDCSIEMARRQAPPPPNTENLPNQSPGQRVTLSGLLNFIDGLWSSCGDERIIIFTANNRDKLEPALLRPGRMDMHIHMSYCSPCSFKLLASNYLGFAEHPLGLEVEQLIQEKKVTPAEVGGELLKSQDPEMALTGLIQFLKKKNNVN